MLAPMSPLARRCRRNCEFSGRRYVGQPRVSKADVPSAAKRSAVKSNGNRLLASAIVVGAALLMASSSCTSAAEGGAAGLRIARDDSTLSIYDGNRLVLRYRYADVPMKPYVDELVSPAGVQVLRDSPSDHKHHHGLMYALAVDKVDFWAEFNAQYGKELHRSLGDVKATARDGVARAGFVQQLDWVGPASERPLLVERRAIDVLRGADLGATLVQWQCSLQTPSGKDAMVLGGSHYFGLGMRFLTSMDHGGHFFNADDKRGEVVHGDEQLTPTKWCAYTAKADGRPVTVALFDHPGNLRHPAKMFTMNTPFAYLSATMNAWKEPITVKAGHPLNLCYGVALWDGAVDKATVEKLYQRWLKLTACRETSPSP